MRVIRLYGFLTAEECEAVRRGMDAGLVETAEVLADGIHEDARARAAAIVEPEPGLVRSVETRLGSCRHAVAALGIDLGEREGAGFIRYPAGGFYRPHVDRGGGGDWEPAARRAVALVVFLNGSRGCGRDGEFDGGLLRLYFSDGEVDIVPEMGLLVAFPADVLHEVTEVRGGTRDTIVDWYYDREG